jgi:hypothetical protein
MFEAKSRFDEGKGCAGEIATRRSIIGPAHPVATGTNGPVQRWSGS